MPKPIELLTIPEFVNDLAGSMTQREVATKWNCAPSTVSKWRNRLAPKDGLPTQEKARALAETLGNEPISGYKFEKGLDGTVMATTEPSEAPQTVQDCDRLLRDKGIDPDAHDVSYGFSEWGVMRKDESSEDGYSVVMLNAYRIRATPKKTNDTQYPLWPVIQPVAPKKFKKRAASITLLTKEWKTAALFADTQIGYRLYEDGTLDPFHDDAAMDVALQIIEVEDPDRVLALGDIIDLQEQGRWAQEASFANTTQAALDRTYELGCNLREATTGEIDFIEGNHERRMQNFVEVNAKSAFGLKMAGMPESWPVMSLPNLLRLDELSINYHDAYPTAHVWINNVLRAEHGTKVNSNGSTAQKYMNETPHISRAFGHTHRLEMLSRTTYDRAGKIRSVAINPGCLCRVDGAVPGVHGAIGISGRPAYVAEDWQQGIALVRYTEDVFRVELIQIEDGMTFYQNQQINSRV